jgi:phosphohistidine phosphatase
MKTLLLIRHAKSSWTNIGQTDFNRPLNDRGIKDAAEMAERLFAENILIDTFITSTANRALTTCKAFADAYKKDNGEIILIDKLYHAPPHVFYEVIKDLKDDMHNVAIFAHNPGITELASTITGKVKLIDMPTCGVYALQIDTDSWQDFATAEKEFMFFKFPKEV